MDGAFLLGQKTEKIPICLKIIINTTYELSGQHKGLGFGVYLQSLDAEIPKKLGFSLQLKTKMQYFHKKNWFSRNVSPIAERSERQHL